MDEDDQEIVENVMTELYLDAESVPAVVVVAHEGLASTLVTEYSPPCAVAPLKWSSPSAESAGEWSKWPSATPQR